MPRPRMSRTDRRIFSVFSRSAPCLNVHLAGETGWWGGTAIAVVLLVIGGVFTRFAR